MTPPRLVIDASAWPARLELFAQLEQRVLRGPLQPAALVLTESQAALAPALADLQIRRVRGSAEGVFAAVELAGDTALVLSPWQFDPAARWLAAEFHESVLTLEPADGLAVFHERGFLPPLPALQHPLDRICEPAGVKFSNVEHFTPARRRWWMATLASEVRTIDALKTYDGLRQPAMRLAFARQLGLVATSTAHERLEHELDQLSATIREALGLPIEVLDAEAHADRLARAAQRPTPPAAWRWGDKIHLIDPTATIEHPRLAVHRPVTAAPALTRLLAHIADWSTPDHEADPSLAQAVLDLDPEGRERPALLHARAAIQWNNLRPAPPATPRCERWADELRAALAEDPPPASLRLRLLGADGDSLGFADDERLATLFKAHDLLARPRGLRALIADRTRPVVRLGGAPEPVVLHLDTGTAGSVEIIGTRSFCHARVYADPADAGLAAPAVPAVWLPVLGPQRPDVDLWLDCLERSSALAGWTWEHSPHCERLLRHTLKTRIELLASPRTRSEPVRVEPATWTDADLQLAHLWLALRAALERPLAAQLATGVVCSLGAGVSAHLAVHARRAAAPTGVVAALDAVVDAAQVRLESRAVFTAVAGVGGQLVEIGVRVPAQLLLVSPALTATVTFVATPLLPAASPTPPLAALLAATPRSG